MKCQHLLTSSGKTQSPLGASLLTGLLFGIAPALQSSKLDLNEALIEGGRTGTDGRGRKRVRSVLVVAEVALSLVLLVGAGLLIKSFVKLSNTDPGFDPGNTLTASLSIAPVRYDKEEKVTDFYRRLVERVRALPGVESAGAVMPLPLGDNSLSFSFTVVGKPPLTPGTGPVGRDTRRHARLLPCAGNPLACRSRL